MISVVACCHGAELCALAARDFRSQQDKREPFSHLLTGDIRKPVQTSILGEFAEHKLYYICSRPRLINPTPCQRSWISDGFYNRHHKH